MTEPAAVMISGNLDRVSPTHHQFLLGPLLVMHDDMPLDDWLSSIFIRSPSVNLCEVQRCIPKEATSVLVTGLFYQSFK